MKRRYHTLIVGSGCAGFHAALRLHDLGVTDIAIITEGIHCGTSRNTGSDKQTYYKLSLSGFESDSVRDMAQTLYAGGSVMGEHALCEAAYSARCFLHLVELGVPFPTNEFGEYVGYQTDHDHRRRATSAGPLTSRYMTEALERAVRARSIEILSPLLAVRILKDAQGVCGLACIQVETGERLVFSCQNILLCTGGPAGAYAYSVYPESQHGALSLPIEAGAVMSNLDLWQYGIASTDFRWNLSGSYQQVLPRYYSVDSAGHEVEFLYDALGAESLNRIFLKGYQWPFDVAKIAGSSQIDLLVAEQIKAGRRVYLDFTTNPKGLEEGFDGLCAEAHDYLERCGALGGTPITRLARMNHRAIKLYADHGIDLWKEPLAIAVCAQHCNGGVAVDENWQSSIPGLYAAGEAAGTFGLYRPGGSALNSTQVGSLRAAEHIAAMPDRMVTEPSMSWPAVRYGRDQGEERIECLRQRMSQAADFDRSLLGTRALYDEVTALAAHFFEVVEIADDHGLGMLFTLYDTVVSQRAILSAMLCSAEQVGSCGSALVDRRAPDACASPGLSRTLTCDFRSWREPVSPIPDPELWFETVLARYGNREDKEER